MKEGSPHVTSGTWESLGGLLSPQIAILVCTQGYKPLPKSSNSCVCLCFPIPLPHHAQNHQPEHSLHRPELPAECGADQNICLLLYMWPAHSHFRCETLLLVFFFSGISTLSFLLFLFFSFLVNHISRSAFIHLPQTLLQSLIQENGITSIMNFFFTFSFIYLYFILYEKCE